MYVRIYCLRIEQDNTFRAQALIVNHSRLDVLNRTKNRYITFYYCCLARLCVNVPIRIKIIFWDDKNYQKVLHEY